MNPINELIEEIIIFLISKNRTIEKFIFVLKPLNKIVLLKVKYLFLKLQKMYENSKNV
jgi:hypothetical protein